MYYKRAEIVGVDSRPLAELLRDALNRKDRPLQRAQHLGEDGETVRLVNKCYEHEGLLTGCLLNFTEGNHQPTVRLDDAIELLIDQIPPREREQFIEGMLFFGVRKHHLILIQSAGLRSHALEEHLNWFLREQTRVLQEAGRVVLVDEPSSQAQEKLRGVQSVVLRAPVTIDNLRGSAEGTPNPSDRHTVAGVLRNQLWQLVQGQGTFFEDLRADQALALEDVEISLEIKRRGRKKEGPSLLDELAHALRHADDDVFELTTKSGKVLKSGDLKLSTSSRVQTKNGMPLLADVAEKMHDWLATLIDERQVSEV